MISKQSLSRKTNITSGFSLIELMVVIAIVAVLSTIAVPSYKTYLANSRLAHVTSIAEKSLTDWSSDYVNNIAYSPATGPVGNYIQTITSGANGVSVTLNTPSNIDSTLDGAVITYTPSINNEVISWGCSVSTGSGGAQSTTTYYTANTSYTSNGPAGTLLTPSQVANWYTGICGGSCLYKHPHVNAHGGLSPDAAATARICK
jgi:prepilin-type N-terminal cleavage/methylation domain-containing protein